MSGDVNPANVDPAFAKDDMFHKVIADGMWGGALISTVLGTGSAISAGRGEPSPSM
jgi:phosphate acetyltransferase